MTGLSWRALLMAGAACFTLQQVHAQGAQQPPAQQPPATAQSAAASTVDARPWPRAYSADGIDFAINQPQIDSWDANILKARVVVAVKTGETRGKDGKTTPQHTFGVAWLQARTETDKDAREVTLHDLRADSISFPTAKDKEAAYLAALRKVLPATGQVMSLDVIESALAISGAIDEGNNVPVSNTPPEIIFSFAPALLVRIDGEPVWRPTGVSGVEHVLNSHFSILRYQNKYYIGSNGRWGVADSLQGTWTGTNSVPGQVSQALSRITANDKNRRQSGAKEAESTKYAAVYIRTKPAELITVDGQPTFDDIEGTGLSFVTNTPADVFLDKANNWYVLISGRWFTAQSTKGPWTYIASNKLPPDFAKIPSDGPKGAVLASIAGTPEAKESLVANSVPQTATVNRKEAKFTAAYDGAPRFEAIAGTSLSAAKNANTPVIKVNEQSYVALDKGVWFTSKSPTGPWEVATSVPAEVYSIPTTSPLHYVTYVRIYQSTDQVVYVGYTPGYYGTVASNGVVVYGTGYQCDAWVGNAYYDCPSTYGSGAAFAYGAAAGWALAFGWGYYNPWYYPMYYPYWGPWYYPGYGGGAAYGWGNVYGHWGNSVVAGTGAAWANAWTGNYGQGYRGGYYNQATSGRGYGYAARNTNVYTGNTRAEAGGIRYNPETGRVVAGQGGMAGNIYTGTGVAGGSRTAVNTETGRVTDSAGGIARTQSGTTAAGGFDTAGAGGDAKGGGYVRYDRDTGEVNKGGAVNVNGDVYAGRNGNVYKYDQDSGSWSSANGDGSKVAQGPQQNRQDRAQKAQTHRETQGPPAPASRGQTSRDMQGSDLNNDRLARQRGAEREAMSGRGMDYNHTRPSPSFDRGGYGGGFHGRMGGFRGGRGRF